LISTRREEVEGEKYNGYKQYIKQDEKISEER